MRVRRRFAQHFLERPWVDKLVERIEARPDDVFLEIGPGRGALTLALAPLVGSVYAVEIDRDLARDLAALAPSNVHVVAADALQVDLASLLPQRADGGGRLRVTGNLPYNVTSPMLARLFALYCQRNDVVDAVLMLQREVVDRLVAVPGTKQYGALTVRTRLHADAHHVLSLPPGAFRPKPKVASAVVRLVFRPPPVKLPDPAAFDLLVTGLFTQRRKMLLNSLSPLIDPDGPSARDRLAAAGIDPTRRPETLELGEFADLVKVCGPIRNPAVL